MQKLKENILSKKFQAMLGGVFINLGIAMTGKMTWADSATAIVLVLIAYSVVQGAVDFAAQIKSK